MNRPNHHQPESGTMFTLGVAVIGCGFTLYCVAALLWSVLLKPFLLNHNLLEP